MKANIKQLFSNTRFKNGSYSVGVTAIVLAIVIVINLMVNQLPSTIKQVDISSNQIYSIGEITKDVLNDLDKEVKIVILATPDHTDPRIETLVNNYKSLSDKIKVETIDPVLRPTALTEYEAEANNLVVSCEATGKSTAIPFEDIILYDEMSYYYYGQYIETEFDGEGQLTSAIDFVTNEANKTIYTLSGHGEDKLSTSVTDLIQKANMNLASINLLTDGAVPEDCDLLLINALSSDISSDEKDILLSYLKNGGHMMVLFGSMEETFPNIESILAEYGLEMADGYIADTERYYQGNYYAIFPELSTSHSINNSAKQDALALVNNVRGMVEVTPSRDSIAVEPFMSTSSNGYAVTESEQVAGTYILGATVTEQVETTETKKEEKQIPSLERTTDKKQQTEQKENINESNLDVIENEQNDKEENNKEEDNEKENNTKTDTETIEQKETKLTVISAGSVIEEYVTANAPSLYNLNLFMNAVIWNFDDVSNISIPSKSLEVTYNTIPTAGFWNMVIVIIIPVIVFVMGFTIWFRRRRA